MEIKMDMTGLDKMEREFDFRKPKFSDDVSLQIKFN